MSFRLFSDALKLRVPSPAEALPGRSEAVSVSERHFVLGTPLRDELTHLETALFGMGCFWGAERKFWQAEGVHGTAVGYAGGLTPNPTYEEVCGGLTGHTEVVRVTFDLKKVSFENLLRVFWENHDPTQGMRQGNDVGTQYRSAVFTESAAQLDVAEQSKRDYEQRLHRAGFGAITTELRLAPEFYFAEDYHQQSLAKNPNGYCGIGGTGVLCPVGLQA